MILIACTDPVNLVGQPEGGKGVCKCVNEIMEGERENGVEQGGSGDVGVSIEEKKEEDVQVIAYSYGGAEK